MTTLVRQKVIEGTGLAVLVAAIFYVDWWTGYETSVLPLYMLAVFLATRCFHKSGGVLVSLAVALGCATVERIGGRNYSNEWLWLENLSSQLVILVVSVWVVDGYRTTLEHHRQRVAALEKLLTICPGCGRIAGGDGRWYAARDYKVMHKKETYCVCPACVQARAAK